MSYPRCLLLIFAEQQHDFLCYRQHHPAVNKLVLRTANLLSVSDFIDVHSGLIIQDRMNYLIISLTNAASFLCAEFLGCLRPGIIS